MKTPPHLMIRNLFSRIFAAGNFILVLPYTLTHKNKTYENYLSIAAVIKDEGPYLREWIEYHKLVGVEKFYLYDAATDNSREILEPYIASGDVVYVECKGRAVQIPAYNKAIRKTRFKTRWLALIDADEFLAPVGMYSSLPELLHEYEQYPALGVNWVFYDSNGHIRKPEGLVIKNYTSVHGIQKSCTIKSIVNPRSVIWCGHPHYCHYAGVSSEFRYAVNENFEKVSKSKTVVHSSEMIRLSHYYSKSEEEFEKKCCRGCADSALFRKVTRGQYLFDDSVQDTTMLKYADNLERILAEK